MKHIVSISIGSSKRNHKTQMELLGETYVVERRGTDGDIKKAIELVKELDGKVDAFGMGGIDVYLNAGKKRYKIKDALPIRAAAQKTPMVDGSGLKISLEKLVAHYINDNIEDLKNKKAFILPAIDRYAMAEGFEEVGCQLNLGDLMVVLGIGIPIRSLRTLDRIAKVIAPIACKLPIEMLYPTGKEQNKDTTKSGKFDKFFEEADIIAGDFHYIKQYMPPIMDNKIIVTNTVTKEDIEWLRDSGVRLLVTSTPDLEGRSFGTNVIEALLVAFIGKSADEITSDDYLCALEKINFKPRVEYLQENKLKAVINK
ncbi:MAG: quinate 5-dehydrogenase [Clostridiales bacterium GWB2_37_7]|nr:MAG: quinate 5-dehydrogenase [Clostridiales bacterium GWB2_37_7]